MRRPWRRVAERADKDAFNVVELSEVLVDALEQDCRADLGPSLLGDIQRIVEEPSLFKGDMARRLEPLREHSASGMARTILNNVERLSASEEKEFVREALKIALLDHANRCARQVEEHYLRRSTSGRSNGLRARLDAGIACSDFGALATRLLCVQAKRAQRKSLKKTGLDDGVSLL